MQKACKQKNCELLDKDILTFIFENLTSSVYLSFERFDRHLLRL